ncbi:substrate-binding domain-containing protein [Streptomyces sp. NPDC060194]|uniref:substrate-binding domain-containing protein n=1 Tax=Streptomyces sp. NPDC060194 TaxID=3347069 RepID=UPI00366A3178
MLGGLTEVFWAVVATVIATALTGLVQVYRLRHRIAYRVQLNESIRVTSDGDAFRLQTSADGGRPASVVLLRIENVGFQELRSDDIERELYVSFPRRTLIAVEAAEASRQDLRRTLDRELVRTEGAELLALPRLSMKRKDHFKLLLVLTGPRDADIRLEGHILGGRIVEGHARQRRRDVLWSCALVLSLSAGLLGGYGLRATAEPPDGCPTGPGGLTLVGSTAFGPAVTRLADDFRARCGDTEVTIDLAGSGEGLRRLTGPDVVAFTDGPAPTTQPGVSGRRVAVITFRVVVNKGTGVRDLTLAQVRDVFAGRVTDWGELGGRPGRIRVVGRDSSSGSRTALEQRVLRAAEGPTTSNDCVTFRRPRPPGNLLRCERRTTSDVLAAVDAVPGAIGYADSAAASSLAQGKAVAVTLAGAAPSDAGALKSGAYPYWAVEYAHTRGTPAPGSPAAAFLDHLTAPSGAAALRAAAVFPCDAAAPGLCA